MRTTMNKGESMTNGTLNHILTNKSVFLFLMRSYMESEDSAPNCSSNGNHSEMDDYLDEALEDDDDCDDEDDDYNYRNQNAAVS